MEQVTIRQLRGIIESYFPELTDEDYTITHEFEIIVESGMWGKPYGNWEIYDKIRKVVKPYGVTVIW